MCKATFSLRLHMHKNNRERDDLPTSKRDRDWLKLCLLQKGEKIKVVDQGFVHQEEDGERIKESLQILATKWERDRERFKIVLQVFIFLIERELKVFMWTFKLHQFMKEMRDSNMEKRELFTKTVWNLWVISVELKLCSMYLLYLSNTKKGMSINSQAHLLTKNLYFRERVSGKWAIIREIISGKREKKWKVSCH